MYEHLNYNDQSKLIKAAHKFNQTLVAAKATFFIMAGIALLGWAFK